MEILKTYRVLTIKGAILDTHQLEHYLEKIASDHVLKNKSDKDTYPIPRLIDNYEVIKEVYHLLNESLKNGVTIHPAGEWILDNFYVIEETVKTITKDLSKKKYTNFLGLVDGPYAGFARIYVLASEIISYTDGAINPKDLALLLKSYQNKKTLSMDEIWNIGLFLQIALIENMRGICEKIYSAQIQKYKVENILERLVENRQKEELKFRNIPMYKAKIVNNSDMKYPFMEYMSYRLKKYGKKATAFLNILEEQADKMGTTISEIIKKEHFHIATQKVSMGNSMKSIKELMRVNFLEIFESINSTNEILKQDPAGVYDHMDYHTKTEYRNKIKQLSQKTKIAEVYIAKKVLELAKREQDKIERKEQDDSIENRKKTHIGYYLMDNGENNLLEELQLKPNRTLKTEQKVKQYVGGINIICFLLVIIIGTVIQHKLSNPILTILTMLLFYLPILPVISQIVQYILGKVVKPKRIPKLDMQNGVPKEYATFVVIPTIIKTKEKVEELFEKLEVYYIANQSDNLYFALLGDCSASSKVYEPYDEEVIKAGYETIERLNKKYPDAVFPKFQFIYRQRVWNPKEKQYLGWERKRGLLNQFNEYLLGNISNPFKANSLEDAKAEIPSIKYIITLDSDTDLILNSGLELIGAMAHILNTPVVNKNQDIVVQGYALMQPRVGIDIDASMKSRFTKIFAGFGGTDSYTNAISNFYQDNFGEGIFTGKGIYDVAVFSNLLEQAIPENTVLSHDLLEGSYLRCGLVSDIMLMDGYPSQYNSFMARLHRWIRGDWQIIMWLTSEVMDKNGKKRKNPLNFLSQFKILDNLIRSIQEASILFAIIWMLFLKIGWNLSVGGWLTLLLGCSVSPMLLDVINYIIFKKDGQQTQKSFAPVITGLRASILRGIISLGTLPHKAMVQLNAITKTIYRMKISGQNLLEWTTAEEAEKNAKTNFISYYQLMKSNVLLAAVVMMICFIYVSIGIHGYTNGLLVALGTLWLLTPGICWYISKPIPKTKKINEISHANKEYVMEVGKRTWQFFKDHISAENNYLPPDNYQEDRTPKVVKRTSSTNIGLGLLAVVSACDLRYITLNDAIDLLEKMLSSISNLSKWNGHLYNWYHLQTLEPLKPAYVSTVDSGNFVSYLFVLKQFLEEKKKEDDKIEQLILIVDKLIKDTDFSVLYDPENRLFSIGFSIEENKLTDSYYDLLASEARSTSLIAIAKKEVPPKHWNNLGRTLTTLGKRKGLVSWAGTSFEYLMPNVVIPKYQGSLLDESCKFMLMSQKEYSKRLGIPWGISEAAFHVKDLNGNYQYKAFGIPWLGLKRGLADEMVVSSYGSILAMTEDPNEVVCNMKLLEKQGMFQKYGFYESIDYTPARLKPKQKYAPIKTYMAHHQGLILLSINNLFSDDILPKRLMKNPEIRAVDILLQEKMPENMIITKEQKEKVEKLKYTDYEDYSEKVENKINENIIESNVISNDHYTVVMNSKAEGYSKLNDIMINRFKPTKDIPQGIFFFIKNIKTKKVWSNAYLSYLEKPDKYEAHFMPDQTKFERTDGNIKTSVAITTAPDENIEIRRLTVKNNGNTEETLEISSYFEPILSRKEADYSHMTFNNLFLSFEYLEDHNILLVKRKKRMKDETQIYLAVSLYTESETIGEIEYEIDKEKLVGRTNYSVPQMIANSKPFSKTLGLVTDPVIALRRSVKLKPEQNAVLDLLLCVSEDKQEAIEKIINYQNREHVKRTFELSRARVEAENRYLGVKGKEVEIYQKMASYLLFQNPTKKLYINQLPKKQYQQNDLWKFGISGDFPILLVKVKDVNDSYVVEEVLKAYEYYRAKNITIDLVILNQEKKSYEEYVKEAIETSIQNRHMEYLKNINGGVFVIHENEVEDIDILEFRANLIIDSHLGNLKEQLKDRQEEYLESIKNIGEESDNKVAIADCPVSINPFPTKELKYQNEYGGFSPDGKEYWIRINKENKLPTVWSHILANEQFGTLLTENMGGYTWDKNSRLNRVTAWANNPVTDVPSEVIYGKDKKTNKTWSLGAAPMPDDNDYNITYGFGYAKYNHTSCGVIQDLEVFVPQKESVKISMLHLKNTLPERKTLKFIYYLKPVLEEDEVKSNGYLDLEYKEKSNVICVRNRYRSDFQDRILYVSSSEKIKSYTGNKTFFMGKGGIANPDGLNKVSLDNENSLGSSGIIAIEIEVELESYGSKDVSFILGCHQDMMELQDISYKYAKMNNCIEEYERTKKYWNELLGRLQVYTPLESTNIILNGWAMYQTIACRLWGRTGYYQSGGALGFRDQLQDTLGIKYIDPEFMKEQILKHARHQFVEGDVLHWWHEDTKRGIRTRFSDDLLWLVYVTIAYLNCTGDRSILEEKEPYLEGELLEEGQDERYDQYEASSFQETIYEHCKRAIDQSLQLGENGIPKIGSGDWNDGFSRVGNKGKGESIWLGFFLYTILTHFIPIVKQKGEEKTAIRYQEVQEKLRKALNTRGWDGRWFKRAYMDSGEVLGSMENEECRIDSIAQSWSVISNAGDNDKKYISMESLENHLVDRENGIIKLLDPPFEKSKLEPGYIKAYMPGVRENGGQYTHAATWAIIAECLLGFGNKANEFFRMINPIEHARTKEQATKYKVEPYVIAADVYRSWKFSRKRRMDLVHRFV